MISSGRSRISSSFIGSLSIVVALASAGCDDEDPKPTDGGVTVDSGRGGAGGSAGSGGSAGAGSGGSAGSGSGGSAADAGVTETGGDAAASVTANTTCSIVKKGDPLPALARSEER